MDAGVFGADLVELGGISEVGEGFDGVEGV